MPVGVATRRGNPVLPVLSIQSHVAYGHVGNMAAVFALQRLGHEVWPIDTVHFATHTGYGPPTGAVASAGSVRRIVERLDREGVLARCDAVLTGYVGSADVGRAILDAVDTVRARNPAAIWCCDPVIGYAGRGPFVEAAVAAFFERNACRADILLPNAFELATLTGARVRTAEDVRGASRALLDKGVRLVVTTGVRADDGTGGRILSVAATAAGGWAVAVPEIDLPGRPNGAGDLFAAVFLGLHLGGGAAPVALSHAAGALHGVLQATASAGSAELAMIEAQAEIADPAFSPAPERLW